MLGRTRGGRRPWRRPTSVPVLILAAAASLSACGSLATVAVHNAGTAGATDGQAQRATPPNAVPTAARSAKPTTATTRTATTKPAPTTTTLPLLSVAKFAPVDAATEAQVLTGKAQGVASTTPLSITYNRAPWHGYPMPTISPAMPGKWSQAAPNKLAFEPAGYWQPGTTYTVSVPVAAGAKTKFKFTTQLPPVLVLQQYLAMLGYLPLRFTPTGDIPNRKAVLAKEPANPYLVPQAPLSGVFTWAYADVPTQLWAQWHRAQPNVMTTSAVMEFEDANGLAPDGQPGPLVWHALLQDIAKRATDPNPYNYVIVSEALPETLYVWQDGKFVYNTLTNTGVNGANTPLGTWPVAYKQNPNLMKGCDVNGSCYRVWVKYASYFLPTIGDAIHAYPRASYGFPQSNGCVEVPESQGAVVYSYDPVGTLVTVTSWKGPAQVG